MIYFRWKIFPLLFLDLIFIYIYCECSKICINNYVYSDLGLYLIDDRINFWDWDSSLELLWTVLREKIYSLGEKIYSLGENFCKYKRC